MKKSGSKKSSSSVIFFDYDGYYSSEGEERWISRNQIYSLFVKTSVGALSYSGLIEKICSKVKVDETTTKLKISYQAPLLRMRIPYVIKDDEDVVCYLAQMDNEGARMVLNVQVTSNVIQELENEKDHELENISRKENVGDIVSSNVVNASPDAIVTHYLGEPDVMIGEPYRQHEVVVGKPSRQNEVVENDGNDYNVNEYETFEDICVEKDESESLAWEDGLDIMEGQKFFNREELHLLVEKAGHQNCFEYDLVKSEPTRYVVKCSEARNGCNWYVRAARNNTYECYTIRTHKKMHTCSRTTTTTSKKRRKGTQRLIAFLIAEDYPGKFDTPRPKKAASAVRGSSEESYMLLYSYMFMLKQRNADTVYYVEVDKNQKFKYLFFALGVCIEGFRVMRKVIIVDGTHIRNGRGGVLIVATTQDPDHHHYPLAFGVVDSENNPSWSWFFNKLKSVIPDSSELVFISDRNQSLIKAIGEVYPLSEHGHCMYHLSQNVKGNVSGVNKEEVAKAFRACSRAYTEAEFVELYADLKSRFPAADAYLNRRSNVRKWARCYFPGVRYNIDTTNCAESINGVFREARGLSLLPMIDVIIEKLGKWFNKYRKISAKVPNGQKLVPFVENEFHIRCKEAKFLTVYELNSFRLEYIVIGRDGIRYLVALSERTCSCKRFDIDRYPCVHAIAAAREAKLKEAPDLELQDLCSKYYWMELWVLAYHRTIYPVPHMSEWNVLEETKTLFALQLDYEIKVGRHQERRHLSIGEYHGKKKTKGQGWYQWFNSSGDETPGDSQT